MAKKFSVKLTSDEINVLHSILISAKDCMQWNEDMGEYTDGGRFILSLTEDEYRVMQGISLF